MTNSQKQKRNILVVGTIVLIAFLTYSLINYLGVGIETKFEYAEYNNGYKLVSYTHGILDKNTEIVVPEQYEGKKVIALDDKVFSGCKTIKNIVIPTTVTEMGSAVFKGCTKLESVILSENLEIMGGECFKDCKSLKEIILPDSLKELRGETFMGCTSLKSVVLPINITEIKGNTFENCTSLEEINIPSGVTRIAAHAFYGCTSLSAVFIPDTVNEIGSSAFRKCDSLEKIELPEGVDINERAFKESPTRLLKKLIPDDLWDAIEIEVQSKDNYDTLYVIYDKGKSDEEILILDDVVCVVDSIKYEDVIKDEFALREFTEPEELIDYLEEARKKGAQYALIKFYTEVGSKAAGQTYFVESINSIEGLIEELKASADLGNSMSNDTTYDDVTEAEIDSNIGSAAAFDMTDIETYELPDATTNSGLNAAGSVGE